MKKLLILIAAIVMCAPALRADEGMWLLPFIKKQNIKDMKAEGFKLSAEDIYSINKAALKDAIVIFGGGCTGEIVSAEGLLLTNHHCGFGAIQQHSSVENDYLKNGFWAMSRQEEIPTPDLSVTFIRKIVDVSDQIIPKLDPAIGETERMMVVDSLSKPFITAQEDPARNRTAYVRAMFGGNQYFMFVVERYNDVRLVGAPPQSIGKFGGDTDNWMWPRHTGDFSVFRVYSDAQGCSAGYSKDNVPYKSPVHLKISLKGIKSGDFAMIMGFPGRTQRYMTSFEIDQMLEVENPVRIFVRGERQEILMADMMASDKVRIQYAAKYAQSSNYWKNSIGMSRGLRKLDVKSKKLALENQFSTWCAADPSRTEKYNTALPLIREAVTSTRDTRRTSQYLLEALVRGVEIISQGMQARALLAADTTKIDEDLIAKMKAGSDALYKDYSPATDRKVAVRMIGIIMDSLKGSERPAFISDIEQKFEGNIANYVDYVYDNSFLASEEKYEAFLNAPSLDVLRADPAMQMASSTLKTYNGLFSVLTSAAEKFARGHRLFIAGLMEMQPDKKLYPDANFTMRMTYGQVLPYSPADGVIYDYYTTLSGVMAKEDASNPYEFTVSDRLKELYKAKDFGPYAYKGDIPTCFLSNNDITGGNSGSPVMDGRGQLIGLAFDGNWEAMSGDVAFEPELQRTISVDIRYVLFIIDKYAGATHLINEMTIVK